MRRIVLALAVMATLAFTTTSAQAHGYCGHHGYGGYGFGGYGYGYRGPAFYGYGAPVYGPYSPYGYYSGYSVPGFGISVGGRGIGAYFGGFPAYGYGYGYNPGFGW